MWFFKKQTNKEEKEVNLSMSDKVAGKIAGACIRAQRKFANGMNKMFKNMNNRNLKAFLILFCLCGGGYSIYLTASAITGSEKTQKNLKVDQVDVPKHFDKTGDEVIPEAYVDEETFYKMQGFKKYMDSLKQNKSKQYDSIMQGRPGLMDSVQVLEERYYSQKQK
jgi:hypothetical protein